MISFGEGWHNNHHAHPTSARHGLAWYEFDPSWLTVKVMKYFGLAKSVRVAKISSALPKQEAA
jgi:stearoyl-CoA desaturase (delta-9 desaturase)